MKLIGGPNSPFVRKIATLLIEKGVIDQVELRRTSIPAAMPVVNPPLLAINPLGKVPAFETDTGQWLFESDLISEWIDVNLDGPRLIPAEGEARWRTLRWNALGSGGLAMLILWRGERLKEPHQQVAGIIANFDAKLNAILAEMDRTLSELAAAPFCVGQIALASFLGYLEFRFDDLDWRARWPAGSAWYDAISARLSLRATAPVGDPDVLLAWLPAER